MLSSFFTPYSPSQPHINSIMSFAQKQMAKLGWNEGDGLGKNRDGIKKSISVVKKNDTKGVRPLSPFPSDLSRSLQITQF